jgi:hypothetical protein
LSPLRSLLSNERGQALPEFALVLPILMVIVFGIVDFGKAFNYWNSATHIAAEGARYAAVDGKPYPGSPGTLQAQLLAQGDTEELRGEGNDEASVASAQVCVMFPATSGTGTNPDPKRGDPVEVEMTFEYSWIPMLGVDDTSIASTAVMRLERAPTTYSAGCA